MRKFTFVTFLILIVFSCISELPAQTRKRSPKSGNTKPPVEVCQVSQPPNVRGIKLGMPAEELFALYPRFKADFLRSVRKSEDLVRSGGISLGLLGIQNFKHQVSVEGDVVDDNPAFEGLSEIDVSLYDDKILALGFRYEDFEPANIRDFIKQVSRTLDLPENGWKIQKQDAELKCRGFSVDLSFEMVGDSSYIHMQNLTLYQQMNKKISDEVNERERKRRTLKP